jgi:hypothetical protein
LAFWSDAPAPQHLDKPRRVGVGLLALLRDLRGIGLLCMHGADSPEQPGSRTENCTRLGALEALRVRLRENRTRSMSSPDERFSSLLASIARQSLEDRHHANIGRHRQRSLRH